MALFFFSHECNDICKSLGLTEFDLSPNEMTVRSNRAKMQVGYYTVKIYEQGHKIA